MLNVYFLILYRMVMEDDVLFPHGIDALHVNSVSYNFEKKNY